MDFDPYIFGIILHWQPVFSLYTIPESKVRNGVGADPPGLVRTKRENKGSILSHNSSGISWYVIVSMFNSKLFLEKYASSMPDMLLIGGTA